MMDGALLCETRFLKCHRGGIDSITKEVEEHFPAMRNRI